MTVAVSRTFDVSRKRVSVNKAVRTVRDTAKHAVRTGPLGC